MREGSEEYLDSEKYQLRHWDLDDPPHAGARCCGCSTRSVTATRPCSTCAGLRFHGTDNDALLCYSKREPGGTDAVLVVVNLDPFAAQAGWLDVDLAAVGLPYESTYTVHDELGGGTYTWQGGRNWVRLDPARVCPPTSSGHLARCRP